LAESSKFYAELRTALDGTPYSHSSPSELSTALLEVGESSTEKGEHKWPPLIQLTEARGYTFDSGKATVSQKFHQNLSNEVVRKIIDYQVEYDVDVLEVVGHTDEQRLAQSVSNLD